MKSTKLRIGIIGCGDIAEFAGLCFRFNPSVTLVACCDSDIERAKVYAKRNKIEKVEIDYHKLITENPLDAVYIATPHHLHFEMIACAIQAGVAVLCEKPITTTQEDAQKIVQLSKQSGIKVGVNYQYRYDLAVNQLFKLSKSCEIGKIQFVRLNIPWHRNSDYLAGWRNDKIKSGGGTLLTQGSHAIDFALWICGSKPKQASGILRNLYFDSPVEDLAMGVIELEDGILVQINSTMIANPERALTAEFYTSSGTVIYQNKPFPRLSSNLGIFPDLSLLGHGIFALQRSINSFIEWMLEKDTFLIPAAESIPALASVLAIYRSSESGRVEMINGG